MSTMTNKNIPMRFQPGQTYYYTRTDGVRQSSPLVSEVETAVLRKRISDGWGIYANRSDAEAAFENEKEAYKFRKGNLLIWHKSPQEHLPVRFIRYSHGSESALVMRGDRISPTKVKTSHLKRKPASKGYYDKSQEIKG